MHSPPPECNFCDEHRKAVTPAIMQDYNRHVGYTDKPNCMMNSYSISRWTWKWKKEAILSSSEPYNCQKLYHSCLFWFKSITPTIQTDTCEGPNKRAERVFWPQTERQRRWAPSMSQLKKTWPKTQQTLDHAVYENSVLCVFHQKWRNKNKIRVSRMQHRVVCYPMFWCTSYQTVFLRTNWPYNWKVECTIVSK